MGLNADQITAQNFKDFYGQIRPYLNGTAHGGFTPIGTVISVMGKQAPLNYLVCDGTVYNIADYPELASYFTGQFEASNFFGGDGVTTFAVPDLRGEFLRGTGNNSHTNQGSGAAVGVHQDGTTHNVLYGEGINNTIQVQSIDGQSWKGSSNRDSNITNTNHKYLIAKSTSTGLDASAALYYTSRPTNTSVLYCIATKNIFMDAGHNYSTDEQVVGTWVDGKPLYQRSFVYNTPITINTDVVYTEIADVTYVKELISCRGSMDYANTPYVIPFITIQPTVTICVDILINHETHKLLLRTYRTNGTNTLQNVIITIQYTKTTD